MVRRTTLIAIVLLISLWVLTACGGSEPTPTPTAIPTAAPPPTDTPAPTPEPTTPPEPTATPTEAPPPVEEAPAITETVPVTESAVITETPSVAESPVITESEIVTESMPIEASPAVTDTETMTETAQIAEEPVEQGATASTPAPLIVTDVRPLNEAVGARNPVFAALSPDGSMLAFAQQTGRMLNRSRQLCLYTFASAGLNCTEVPEGYQGYPVSLVWSPDSTKVVFTENPVTLGLDSDIWVWTVADGTMVNRTDDGVSGSYTTAQPGTALIDYMPSWNAHDGMIYFWRVVFQGNAQFIMSFNRISPDEGEPESLGEIAGALPGQLILYDTEAFFLDGMSVISPDGTKVAALFTNAFSNPFATARNSLYVADISDGEVSDVAEVANFDSFQAALPAFQFSPATPLGIAWTSDSQGVVVAASSPDTHTPLILFYYVDIASGQVTPVVDFSGYTDFGAFFEPDANGIPPRYYSPWTGSLSPAGDQLLMLSNLGGVASVLLAPLPPTGELPTIIASTDAFIASGGSSRSSRAADGKVTMYSLVISTADAAE